jgi:hypothetical protein
LADAGEDCNAHRLAQRRRHNHENKRTVCGNRTSLLARPDARRGLSAKFGFEHEQDDPGGACSDPQVKSALIADKYVDTRHINVDTIKGAVVLRGTVPSAAEKQRAAQIAEKAMGDERSKFKLINQLKVSGSTAHRTG